MKNVIITGASGLLATTLAQYLLKRNDCNLFLLSRDPNCIPRAERVTPLSIDSLEQDCRFKEIDFDCLFHTAFARGNNASQLLASLNYLERVLNVATCLHLRSFVNVSSQGIYGWNNRGSLWKEDAPLFPSYPYAVAKCLAETLVNDTLGKSSIRYTNIRLASIVQNAGFIRFFVNQVKKGEAINVMGGDQRYSFVDVEDAAKALMALAADDPRLPWDKVYNLGTGQSISLLDIALMVNEVARASLDVSATIQRTPSGDIANVGMDASRFMARFAWEPKLSFKDSIYSLFN